MISIEELPRLYVGPMSKTIVDAVIDYSNVEHTPLGLCTSRRQIDYKGSYVYKWTTKKFAKYIKDRSSNVWLCRDHGGPAQGVDIKDNGVASFNVDVQHMDIIHIDPFKRFLFIDSATSATASYIKHCYNLNSKCWYEVGTEESIRRMSSEELYDFLKVLKRKLGKMFNKILYAVIQSGTSLIEDRNTGVFDEVRLRDMISICNDFNIASKEHNGDYLDSKLIRDKFKMGLSAINIAPEFGVMESSCIINRISENSSVFNRMYDLCYASGQWKKWVDETFNPYENRKQLVRICGHYMFSNKKFRKLLRDVRFTGVETQVKYDIEKRMKNILGRCNGK